MNSFQAHFKNFVRTAIDCCILPGTMLGTEILWLYFGQWRREWSAIGLAIAAFIFIHFEMAVDTRSVVQQVPSEHKSG
jgi:hypothetical protein